jgi:hypothetical protein
MRIGEVLNGQDQWRTSCDASRRTPFLEECHNGMGLDLHGLRMASWIIAGKSQTKSRMAIKNLKE